MKLFLFLITIFLGALLLIRLFEEKLIFFPSKYPAGQWRPERFGLQVEDCTFTTAAGVKLHGWFVGNDSAKATLLWCHGNAGNITDRLDNLARLAKLPINIFLFDYRGYGKSEGRPNEAGVYLDAQAAYDFLASRPDVNAEQIVIFGRSLGGAVAVDLATRRAHAGLILESTFGSARDMAGRMFPFLPVRWVMKSEFDSISRIKDIATPKLFLHGDADEIVPFELGQRLFEAAPEPKSFHRLRGAHHNDTYFVDADYFHVLRRFVETLP